MERVVDVHKDGTRTIELPHPDLLQRFAALVAEHERQECAKVCDAVDKSTHPADLADAIRARGEKK